MLIKDEVIAVTPQRGCYPFDTPQGAYLVIISRGCVVIPYTAIRSHLVALHLWLVLYIKAKWFALTNLAKHLGIFGLK